MAKFSLGQIVATPAALRALEKSGESPLEFIARHARGDWGEFGGIEDAAMNDAAMLNGGRIFSSYKTKFGKLWVITTATDDEGNRESTCVLLPSDY